LETLRLRLQWKKNQNRRRTLQGTARLLGQNVWLLLAYTASLLVILGAFFYMAEEIRGERLRQGLVRTPT